MDLTGNAIANNTLRGKIGSLKTIQGHSAYEVAVINGFRGTEEEWLKTLVGPIGPTGDPGFVIDENEPADLDVLAWIDPDGSVDASTTITPQYFGAVGDGETDDTAAFQQAVDSGLNVLIPSGSYRVSNINISLPISIIGIGEVRLKTPDTFEIPDANTWSEDMTVFLIRSVNNVHIENIHFDGNLAFYENKYGYGPLARFDHYGVRVREGSENITIRRCQFDDFKDAGIQITQMCKYVTVEQCQFFLAGWPGTFNRGIQAVQSTQENDAYYTFRGNRIENCGEHGIVVYFNNYHCVIDGNYIKGCGLLFENPDGSSDYTAGCNIKASGASHIKIINNYCEDAIDCNIGLYGTKVGYLEDNVVSGNTCIGSEREDYKGSGISCEGGSLVVSGNIVRGIHVKKYAFSSGLFINAVDAVINGNRVEDCDVGIRAAGAPITGNHVQATSPIVVSVCENVLIADNVLIGDGTTDGISLYAPKNTTISGNVISKVRYGIMGRTSAENVTIYGNIFNEANRTVNWYGFTPRNTRIDFELQYTKDLANIQKAVQNGTAKDSYPVGTQFLVPYTYEDNTYTFIWNVVDYRDVTLQDGSVVPGMVLQAHYASIESPVFDAPENEVATEEKFTPGYFYYLADDTVDSGFALQTSITYGAAIPTGKTYYHSAIRDTTGRIVATGCACWAKSSVRQWLNSAKGRGEWWKAQHLGDMPAADAENLNGFMAGFKREFLNIIKPVKVSTYDWTEAATKDTYDTFFLPSLEQIYATPVSEGEGAAFAYWKDKLGTDAPAVNGTEYPEYIALALEDEHTARTWKLRTHDSNRYTEYVVHHTGRYTTVVPSDGHYVLPVCVVC